MKNNKTFTAIFADRCKEYQDSGINLTPSCIQTIRSKFGAYWVTFHLYQSNLVNNPNIQVEETLYTN